jgi:hypothetical protein
MHYLINKEKESKDSFFYCLFIQSIDETLKTDKKRQKSQFDIENSY